MTELSKSFMLRRAAVDGKDGKDGTSGQGAFKSIVFRRYASQPDAPTGGSYTSPVPTDWSDGIPAESSGLPCWLSSRVFTSDGKSPQTSVWTTPQKIADTNDIDFCFSAKETPSTPPDTHPTQDTEDWHDTATEADIWMAVAKCSNGTWGAWEVTKIKGEKGETGGTGEKGADGESAWRVVLSPEVLSFETDSNGNITNGDTIGGVTGDTKLSTVSVLYGTQEATIDSLTVISNSLVGIASDDIAISSPTVGYAPNKELVASTSTGNKYTRATAGSASFTAVAHITIDGAEVSQTLTFTLQFTCDVHTAWAELIMNDTTFSSKLTKVETTANNAKTAADDASEALKTFESEITQTADEIKLQVAENTAYTNLIPNSWLNMVSNDYGGTCVRTVQLTAGKTYILSVEGRTINAARLRCYIYDADWTEQAYAQITSTSMTTATRTFTPKTTGTYYIDFYNRTGSDSQYYHVRRVKLEVAQMQDNDGNYIATGWCESEQDTDNSNLAKKLLFTDTATVTGIDGTDTTAYLVKVASGASYADGGRATYPVGTSSLAQLAAGETYTLSFFAKATVATTIYSYLLGTTSEGTETVCQGATNSNVKQTPSQSGDGTFATSIGTEWQRVTVTFTTKTTLPAGYQLLVCRLFDTSASVYITDVKLERGGRYTSQAVTPDDLYATGIDIKKNIIELTADNFKVRNNAGQETASIDKEGNLTVPALKTTNKANSAGYAVGNVVIRNNLIELFGASFKVMEIGVEQDNGFIHFFNQSGRLVWGVEDGGAIDYKTGVVVNLTNLQYLPDCFSDNSQRLKDLIAAAAGKAILTDEEQAAMVEMTKSGATEVLARYYAPHESATSDTTIADDAHDLTTAAQTAAYDQRVFVDGLLKDEQLVATYYGLTSNSDLWERLRFDVSPLTSTDTDGVTYRWDIHEIIVSGDSKNMVSNNYTFYYTAAIS